MTTIDSNSTARSIAVDSANIYWLGDSSLQPGTDEPGKLVWDFLLRDRLLEVRDIVADSGNICCLEGPELQHGIVENGKLKWRSRLTEKFLGVTHIAADNGTLYFLSGKNLRDSNVQDLSQFPSLKNLPETPDRFAVENCIVYWLIGSEVRVSAIHFPQ